MQIWLTVRKKVRIIYYADKYLISLSVWVIKYIYSFIVSLYQTDSFSFDILIYASFKIFLCRMFRDVCLRFQFIMKEKDLVGVYYYVFVSKNGES